MHIEWASWDCTYMLRPFGWTHTVVLPLRNRSPLHYPDNVSLNSSFGMKPFDLELVEFDEEFFDKLIENIVAFTHELGSLLLSHLARLVDFGLLEIWED